MTREAERAYTTREAAEVKSVSEKTITRAIKAVDNGLPAKRNGRGYLIKASDLDAWFDGLADA